MTTITLINNYGNIILAGITAIAIVVQAIILWQQKGIMNQQKEISKEQGKQEDNYRKISQKPLLIMPFNIIIVGGKSLTLQIQNTGNIPIHDITFFFYYKSLFEKLIM